LRNFAYRARARATIDYRRELYSNARKLAGDPSDPEAEVTLQRPRLLDSNEGI